MSDLWVERHRPSTVDGYVFKDDNMKGQIQRFIDNQKIDGHLLLAGVQGAGKTTLAKLLFNELNVDPTDVLEINASEERGIDTIREKIISFCSTWPVGEYRYVLLDEADSITPDAQKALRNAMEKYSNSSRFILTCNYPQKIIPALHSRLQEFKFNKLDKEEYTLRCYNILMEEGIDVSTEEAVIALSDYVNVTYPDMRKCINLLQQNSNTGKLLPSSDASGTDDYLLNMIELFRNGQIREARKLIVGQAQPEQYNDIYRFFYENLEFWGEEDTQQDEAVLIIAKALANHALVSDPEINLAACLVELNQVRNG